MTEYIFIIKFSHLHYNQTVANIGFAAMLTDEYILIVPFAYHLYPEASGRAGRIKPSDRI
jgi:hypothetical protein